MVKQKLQNKPASTGSKNNKVIKSIKKVSNKSISLLDQRAIQSTRRSSRNLCVAANEIGNCVVLIKSITKEQSKNCEIDEKKSNKVPTRDVQTSATNLFAYTKNKTNSKKSTSSKTVGQVIKAKYDENQNEGQTEYSQTLQQKVNNLNWTNKKCRVRVKNIARKENLNPGQNENVKEQSNMVTSKNKNCVLGKKRLDNQKSILEVEITNNDRENFKKLSISHQSKTTFSIDQNKVARTNSQKEKKIQEDMPLSKKLKESEIVEVLNVEQKYEVPLKRKANKKVNYVHICADDEWCTKDVDQINNKVTRFKKPTNINIQHESKKCYEGSSVTNQEKTNKNPEDNVYEFLSLTPSSESESDPAADVINKLISEGKVKVVNKRKGKPVIKRNKTTKIGNKNKRKPHSKENVKVTNIAPKLQPIATVEKISNPINLIEEEEIDHFDDGVDSDIDIQSRIQDKMSSHDNPGTFSNLARRVIIQQADKNRKNKHMLLDMAKKFVSTPINKTAVPHRDSHLSPIYKPSTPIHNSKPWRVIDPKLPSVLDFNRSSGNLPSFSSFHIPKSPTKKIVQTNHQHLNLENDSLGEITINDTNATKLVTLNSANAPQNCISIPQNTIINVSNSLSSFSSNDSNAENKPPTQKQNCNKIIDENSDIFNLRQLPNPRKTLAHRSPLKTINILEVVVLPPYKSQNCNKTMTEEHVNSKTKTNNCLEKQNVNLFGFEDDITCEEIDKSICENSLGNDNKSLSEKLRNLKKWRPKNDYAPNPESQPIKEVFDDNLDRPKQRCIKQMLCSTFIDSPKYHHKKSPNKVIKNSTKTKSVAEQSNLFKDFEPECTFNKEDSHRTYIRPFRKKRKICNNYLRYLDSDESGEDEDNRILDTSQHDEVNAKKKQKRKDNQENPELKSFIKDFNDMCEEVENYNVNIEKVL